MTSIQWVSGRVLTAFDKLVQNDKKRLLYFNQRRVRHQKNPPLENSERSYNPTYDIGILQTKTLDKLNVIKQLQIQLEHEPNSSKRDDGIETEYRQDTRQETALGGFTRLTKRMTDFLILIQRELNDTAVDLQRELTIVQLEESRKAIEQNAMIRKLTILAFFYLPISTVSSVFGMNVKELQLPQNQPHIWGSLTKSNASCFCFFSHLEPFPY